ncbi:ribosome maturation factor RimM [Oligoflexus tunisiensis]|uniref:ribosome maturation factor RimM n=1 Tax=Oligoflexus tunisiensis TaxID=708132 RepID=UPI00114CEFAE|nr:ribosome maturation factor RimM [Oligoflexus tunisiensis]
MKNAWLQIGIVGKAQGLRGAFFVAQRDEDLPEGLDRIVVGSDPDKARALTVVETHRSGGRPVIQCREVTSREAAESLKMQPIWCDRALVPLEEESEYLWSDLVGKAVLDAEGQRLGRITAVGNFGASDVVRIDADDGRWIEVPFVSAYFDMNFQSDSPALHLTVPAETFAETWNQA